MGDALSPVWVGIGTGIATALVSAIGKLWSELATVRRESKNALEQKDAELAQAHALIVQLQHEANLRGDTYQREHMRDLRRIAGLSHSVEPPSIASDPWPPVVIRAPPSPAGPPPRKPRS